MTVTSGTSVWSTTYSGVPVIPVPSIAPVVAVALTGGNIQATLQTAYPTCSLGTIQYAYNNRTNDNSTWNGYSSWSTNLTSAQTATQGVKYGYKAEARCYVDSVSYSAATEGSEASTIIAIDTPSAPTGLTYGYDWQGTTWSWNATPCPSGSTTNYNVDYSNDYAGDSGWTSLGTNSSWRQTSRYQVNYSMAVKTQCVGSYSTSGWSSATSPLTFYRNAPVIRALIVAGGGGGGFDNGGGGGGGGFIDTYITVTQSMQQTTYWGISIGGGGGPQANGGNSSFMNLTAYGGGRGANCCGAVGGNGGSGGGGSGVGSGNSGYSGNFSPPSGQSYAQFLGQTNSYVNYGGRGGNRSSCSSYTGGGGGGAGNIGGDAWSGGGGPGAQNGGAGAYTSINGGTYAAGGGGGGDCYNGSGGSGGGGNGAQGRGATGGNASGYGSGGGGGSGRSGQGGYGYQGLVIVQSGDGSIPSGTYTGNNTLTVSGYY